MNANATVVRPRPVTQPVVFLAGALRSGTTLLRLMLRQHPRVISPSEFDFVADVLNTDGTAPSPEELSRRLRVERIFNEMEYTLDDGMGYDEMIDMIISDLSQNNRLPILPVHRHFTRLPTVFPDAKYIHLVRDPRDVARSSVQMGWSGNVYYAGKHWIDTENDWNALAPMLREDQHCMVTYEQLVREPELHLRRLAEFMGLEFTPAMIDGYASKSTYEKPDTKLIEQWRRKMTPHQIALVETRSRDLMRQRGYEPSEDELNLGALDLIRLRISHGIGRNRFNIKRYGVGLVVKEKLARWFGLGGWHTNVLERIHHIESQHVK